MMSLKKKHGVTVVNKPLKTLQKEFPAPSGSNISLYIQPNAVRMLLKRGMGNGERGTGNGERGTGNGERGTGNGEWGMGNGE